MDGLAGVLAGGAGIVIIGGLIMLALAIAVLWICMPFAVFGMKPILQQLLAEQKKTNKLLEEEAKRAGKPTDVVLVSTRKAEA